MARNPKGLLIDIDGTLYFHDAMIMGASDALRTLRAQGRLLRLTTNTDSVPPAHIAQKLTSMGFEIGETEIFSAVSAALHYLGQAAGQRSLCLVSEALQPVFAPFHADTGVDCVVVGDCREWLNYTTLNRAFQALSNGARLVCLHKARCFHSRDGMNIDTGAIVAALEYASGCKAGNLGKPGKLFFRRALADLGLEPADVWVVGDDLHTDILGANGLGITSVLVRTGKFTEADLTAATTQPDFVIDSIRDLPELLTDDNNFVE